MLYTLQKPIEKNEELTSNVGKPGRSKFFCYYIVIAPNVCLSHNEATINKLN